MLGRFSEMNCNSDLRHCSVTTAFVLRYSEELVALGNTFGSLFSGALQSGHTVQELMPLRVLHH